MMARLHVRSRGCSNDNREQAHDEQGIRATKRPKDQSDASKLERQTEWMTSWYYWHKHHDDGASMTSQ